MRGYMTPNLYDPYSLGCIRVTMALTKRSKFSYINWSKSLNFVLVWISE